MDPREAKIYYLITTAALLLFVVIGSLLFNIIRFNKKFRALHLERLNEGLLMLENEKLRMASDLHDQVGPLLAAVKMKMIDIVPLNDLSATLLQQALRLTDESMIMIRAYSSELMPHALSQNGLINTIQEKIVKVRALFPALTINFSHNNIPVLDAETMLTVFRIIQEIIVNTLKHADAKNLHILFSYANENVIISTKDNGKGFKNKADNKKLNGLGLYIMQWRTETRKGKFNVQSILNKGTCFYITIPFKDYQKTNL